MRHRGGAESVLHVLDAEEQARAGGPVEIRGGDGVEGAEKDGDGAQDAHGGDALGDAEVGELSVREGHEKPAEESLLADARAEGEREDARKAEGREGRGGCSVLKMSRTSPRNSYLSAWVMAKARLASRGRDQGEAWSRFTAPMASRTSGWTPRKEAAAWDPTPSMT